MIPTCSSPVSKKLALKLILDNIDYRKRCIGLQDIISLSKKYDIWRQALITFFDTPVNSRSFKAFNKN
ncbi:MAG: hypothetical protein SGI96_19655 [Bacteroidota bacterium]|nr:hypothetical protein [Chitinophagaceae bacterium]MDZ4810459.1 hypothetical protein [Bacteroidota bacterium]